MRKKLSTTRKNPRGLVRPLKEYRRRVFRRFDGTEMIVAFYDATHHFVYRGNNVWAPVRKNIRSKS